MSVADKSGDWRTIPMATAECQDCNWTCHRKNAWAVGVQHSRKNGHKVRIEIIRVYYYGDKKHAAESATEKH